MKKDPQNSRPKSNHSEREGQSQKDRPSSSLEDVRKRLQSFGYLNGRIERFYLASLSKTASLFLNRLFLSIRVGLLTGTLSAILMTAGILLFNIDILRSKTDVVLLFFYFEIFFVVVFSCFELLLIYVVSAWLKISGGRRLFSAGQVLSFLAGLAFFSYFVYWGWIRSDSLRIFPEPVIITISIVLLLSCIFVARCTWLGFAVAFHESGPRGKIPDWRRYAAEVLLCLAAIIILIPFLRRPNPEETSPPVAVLSTSDRWIVIGIDGVSLEIFDRFSKSGSLPNFQKLAQSSFIGTLETAKAEVPPVAWTTLATGVEPAEHGIIVPEVRRLGGLSSWMQMTPFELAFHSVLMRAGLGQRQPVSGYMRRTKAFWEILSDSGIRTGVVNWWGSWPARNLRGWNVSERYYYKVISGSQPQDETFPADLFSRYKKPPANASQIKGPEMDRFYMNIFEQQLISDPVRVGALYLPGLDILNYDFLEKKQIDAFTYTDLYQKHLTWIDSEIGRLIDSNKNTNFLLILSAGRSLPGNRSGIIVSGSTNWNKGMHTSRSYPETVIAPMILHTCGVPASRSMNAELIKSVLPESVLSKTPVRFVHSYPKRDQLETAHVDEFNDLLVEQMKSLGYLQ